MRPRRFRYYCETHDVWDSSNDFVRYHSSLAGCQLTAWESVPQASPARPNVGGNLSPEGGHMQSPIKLVPGVAADGQRQLAVRMVEPEDGEVYLHAQDIVTFLRLTESATSRTCAGAARDIVDAIDEVGR